MKQTLATILLLTVVILDGACARRGESATSEKKSATNTFPELSVKQELQRAAQQDSARKVLTITPYRSVRNGQGAEYVFPASMSYSDSGALYISDNNGHSIHHWAVDSATVNALSAQSGNGRLKFPNTIRFSDGRILISDNDGIKVFTQEGHFQRLIRSYFGIFSFIKTKESIFVNTIVRNATAADRLIVKLDQNGKEIGGFGQRRNVGGHNGLDDQAFLAASGNLLFAAFKYRPSVEIYDMESGELSGSFAIDHPVFHSLEGELALKGVGEKQAKGRIFLPRYLGGIQVLGNRIFLCLALPEPEIWEVDHKGTPVGQFQVSGLPVAVDVFGFDVRLTKSGLVVSIGIIDQGWNATVSELKVIPTTYFQLKGAH